MLNESYSEEGGAAKWQRRLDVMIMVAITAEAAKWQRRLDVAILVAIIGVAAAAAAITALILKC